MACPCSTLGRSWFTSVVWVSLACGLAPAPPRVSVACGFAPAPPLSPLCVHWFDLLSDIRATFDQHTSGDACLACLAQPPSLFLECLYLILRCLFPSPACAFFGRCVYALCRSVAAAAATLLSLHFSTLPPTFPAGGRVISDSHSCCHTTLLAYWFVNRCDTLWCL